MQKECNLIYKFYLPIDSETAWRKELKGDSLLKVMLGSKKYSNQDIMLYPSLKIGGKNYKKKKQNQFSKKGLQGC